MSQVLSVMDAFSELDDPRSRVPAHGLIDMLVVALAAVLSGADTWVAIETWGRAKLGWLRKYLPLRQGIASHDTFGRVFAALDSAQFEACFIRWVSSICPALATDVVAMDGKTVRGSHHDGRRAIHLVSAFSSRLGLVLGQTRTADRSNEITAIPVLLDALMLKGAIITIDAMGCQQRVAEQILASEADYVLAVKGNQGTLHEAVLRVFAAIERFPEINRLAEHSEIEKSHGRIETRRCVVSEFESHWPGDPLYRWPGMRSVAMIESIRDMDGVVSTQRRYYISSLPADAAKLAHAVRSHWRIENTMHWVLDMAFSEDQSRTRIANAAHNFAIVRRIAMNLLRQDTATRVGLRTRRLKAGADDAYRAQLLGLVA